MFVDDLLWISIMHVLMIRYDTISKWFVCVCVCLLLDSLIHFYFLHVLDQGMRWQVPWGKHTPAHYKYTHAAKMATQINKDDILPVISIRNPYLWMKSMCNNPYAAKWSHRRDKLCPNLQTADSSSWNTVTVTYGAGVETYPSLAHLFNDWYHEYTRNATYPWIMIRMEGECLKLGKTDSTRQKKENSTCSPLFVLLARPYLSYQGNHYTGLWMCRRKNSYRSTLCIYRRFRQGRFSRSRHFCRLLRSMDSIQSSPRTPGRIPRGRLSGGQVGVGSRIDENIRIRTSSSFVMDGWVVYHRFDGGIRNQWHRWYVSHCSKRCSWGRKWFVRFGVVIAVHTSSKWSWLGRIWCVDSELSTVLKICLVRSHFFIRWEHDMVQSEYQKMTPGRFDIGKRHFLYCVEFVIGTSKTSRWKATFLAGFPAMVSLNLF